MVDEIENIKDQGDDQENEEKKVDLPAETETEDEKKQDLQVKHEENKDKKSNNVNNISKIVLGAFIVAVAIIIFIPKSPEKHGESRSNTQNSTTQSTSVKDKKEKDEMEKVRGEIKKEIDLCTELDVKNGQFTGKSVRKLNDALGSLTKSLKENDSAETVRVRLSAVRMAREGLRKIPRPEEYEKMPYREVARDPLAHEDKPMRITGRVLQVIEGGESVGLRVATKGRYDDVVYVSYVASLMGGKRVLEDDTVTIYGECEGIHSYKATSGTTISIPSLTAERIELK